MAEWGIQSSIDPPSADAMNLHEELKRLNTGAVRQNWWLNLSGKYSY